MKFKLEIDMGNAAFDDNNGIEISKILEHLAGSAEDQTFEPGQSGKLFDHNGNKVGTWEVTE